VIRPGRGRRRALPALIVGSSVFLQLHLVLGLLLGPLADRAFDRAKGLALAAAAGLAAPDPVRSEPGDEPKVLVS
jgi:hypothetical protein